MDRSGTMLFADLLGRAKTRIMADWSAELERANARVPGRVSTQELVAQGREVLELLQSAASSGDSDPTSAAYSRLRDLLAEMSRARAFQGFSPTETATFVFSLKKPVFDAFRTEPDLSPDAMSAGLWTATTLIDGLGLFTMEVFQKSREEVIIRQQREISELSTPVVKLWDGVLALPLIGTLDSERTQVVMENLLQSIVDHTAEIAIIDITGVPTVDTLVAQHLLKTVAAARLMGADCIISGIRPQIAQTMVHLGVELNVVSKATLADALALALQRIGRRVVSASPAPAVRASA
ncbi:STAS domain-containing protein [Chthonobacter albigriseus]|uniref:STAS domain-containing protein n=1 Tax=Chthonobacter albigriseus TaxID=1683161 RepID=UPI0015EFC90F|nr:STAS domain-containing protein [Chthonobacter albigriseus]